MVISGTHQVDPSDSNSDMFATVNRLACDTYMQRSETHTPHWAKWDSGIVGAHILTKKEQMLKLLYISLPSNCVESMWLGLAILFRKF